MNRNTAVKYIIVVSSYKRFIVTRTIYVPLVATTIMNKAKLDEGEEVLGTLWRVMVYSGRARQVVMLVLRSGYGCLNEKQKEKREW